MKFNKVKNAFMFGKYVREDGKYTITSMDRRINGTLKSVFIVTDENGSEVEVMMKLKEAKEKYGNN